MLNNNNFACSIQLALLLKVYGLPIIRTYTVDKIIGIHNIITTIIVIAPCDFRYLSGACPGFEEGNQGAEPIARGTHTKCLATYALKTLTTSLINTFLKIT